MSGSGRRRISKWDLKEVPQLPPGNTQDNSWPGKLGEFIDDKAQPGWRSPEVAGSNGSKWSGVAANNMLKSKHESGFPSREPLPGSRGSWKDDSINKASNEFSVGTMAWDGDGSYSTKMSPGLDEWRQQNRSHSPKSGWTRSYRSRSRSPSHDFRRESRVNDRSRSRSGVSAQSCKDFAAGRCRRGNHCQFLHQDNQNYEDRRNSEGSLTDSWESRHRMDGASKYSTSHDTREYPMRIGRSKNFCNDYLQGKCHRGASCRYVHHDASSDGFGKGSANEVVIEGGNDRRNNSASFEHNREHEPRRAGNIPCKFFAVGNCRNGKFCRFSHHGQERVSPNGRSGDGRWRLGRNSDNVDQLREGPIWSDVTVSDVAKLPEWNEDNNGKAGAPDQRATALFMDDRWDHSLDKENRSWGGSMDSDKAVESHGKEYLKWKTENTGAGMGVSESRGTEKWLGDMDISPAWNYGVQSPNHMVKEEPGPITQSSKSLSSKSLTPNETSLPTCEQDSTREALDQKHHASAVMQSMISEKSHFQLNPSLRENSLIAFPLEDKNAMGNSFISRIDLNLSANILPEQSFNPNDQTSSAQPFSSLNAVGQSQQAFPPNPVGGESILNPQNQALIQEGKSISKRDIGDANTLEVTSGIPLTHNIVSSEQLTQFTNLSASLVHLFGNGQQLPQLYAALNPPIVMEFSPSHPNCAGPVAPLAAASIQPNIAIGSQKQYDPICDIIDPIKPDTSNLPPGFSLNSVEQKSIADGKPEILSKNLSPLSVTGLPNGGEPYKTGSSEEELKHESHQLIQLESVANCEAKENNGMEAEESKKSQENGPSVNVDGDSRTDEGKKNKDAKGIRAFKFALAELVKELLKPTWKEGQISKEAYKTIVKKVVDKVIGTIQGAQIPQTQEKIDQYLSFSKPKLTKLVQAYVEKLPKS